MARSKVTKVSTAVPTMGDMQKPRRVTISLPPELHRQFRGVLALKDMSCDEWGLAAVQQLVEEAKRAGLIG